MSRAHYTTLDNVHDIWTSLGLPEDALSHLKLVGGDGVAAASSFKIGHLAQSLIACSGLAASLIYAERRDIKLKPVSVNREHAVIEFHSEQLYQLDGQKSKPPWGTIGGIHETADGHIRVHDSFPHHHQAALKLVGCDSSATRHEFAEKLKSCNAKDLEDKAVDSGAVIYKLRTPAEWNATAQARAMDDFPIAIAKVTNTERHRLPFMWDPLFRGTPKCLKGIRVLELSRVIAAPVAGRALAAHGADVIWITSPNLPALPDLDIDTSRGKFSVQLDLNNKNDLRDLLVLIDDADVVLQSYRPGSLEKRGISLKHALRRRAEMKPSRLYNPSLVWANLSAWGTDGPWANRRGFDSIVQTASGMNVSEAEHYGDESAARPMPCQALDHGAGYLLATGIMAALYHQEQEGGSYEVDVSLAGVMKYLRSLGQYPGRTGFDHKLYKQISDVPIEFRETRQCAFGELEAIKHTTQIEDERCNGVEVGYERMQRLGGHFAWWFPRFSLGT